MNGVSLAATVIFLCALMGITSAETGISEGPQCTVCEEGMSCFVNKTVPCPPFSDVLRQSDNTFQCVCIPGFFMEDKTCVLCPSGFYCPGVYADAQNTYTDANTTHRRLLSTGSDIVPCPNNSSSIMGADSVSMCLCNIGYNAVNCSIPEFPVVMNNPPENMRSYSYICGNIAQGNQGGQSMIDSPSYWATCNPFLYVGSYMAIDLGKRYKIHGIVTQQGKFSHIVTSTKVAYSNDKFSGFVEIDGGTIFQLPQEWMWWDTTIKTYVYFSQTVTARHIRIYPQTWINMILMRGAVLTSEIHEGPPPALNSSTCKPVCVACEPGKFKAVASNVVECQACPANTYSSSTSECTACPESTESPPGSAVASRCLSFCGPGYTGPDDNCTACEAGKYKNASGSSPCTSCPAGHVALEGSASCTACVPGTYALDGGADCQFCPLGKYSTVHAASSATTCQYCAPGKYSDNVTGRDLCEDCPENSFSNPGGEAGGGEYVQLQCLPCPENMISSAGSAACTCDAGFYHSQGSPLCEPCGPNEFSAPGALTAADCRCRAGYFRGHEGSECVACPVGTFRVFGESELACGACASGSSTAHNASNSSSMCVVCPAGSFVAEAGDCRPCPGHASSLPGTVGSCSCDAGYAPEGDGCAPCTDGFFKALPGNEACAACAPGKIGSAVQARTLENVSCVACAANTYWALVTAVSLPNPYLSYDMTFYPPAFGPENWSLLPNGSIKFFKFLGTFSLFFAQDVYTSGSISQLQLTNFLLKSYNIAYPCVRRPNPPSSTPHPDCKDNALPLILAKHLPVCSAQMPVVPCQIIQDTNPAAFPNSAQVDLANPDSGANKKWHVFVFHWFLEIDAACSLGSQACVPQPVTHQWKWFNCAPFQAYGVSFYWPDMMECRVFDGAYANIASQTLDISSVMGMKKIYARDASLDPVAGSSVACLSCPNRSRSAAGSLNATSCQCDAGYHAVGGVCEACAPGTFKDSMSSGVACSPCGGSTYTPYSAATECLSCPGNSTGHALSNDAELDCRCDPGFTGSDGGPCVACEPGKFKAAAGSHGCVDCGPSAFWPPLALPTEDHCQSCPAHSTRAPNATGLGVLDCHCAGGFRRTNESACAPCPEGFYCPAEHTQTPCPMHSFAAAGASAVEDCACAGGFYGGGGNCTVCPANAFCPADVAEPVPCPDSSSTAGNTSRSVAAECVCLLGFHREEGPDGFSCRVCGGQVACDSAELLACPPNSTAPRGATNVSACVCDPGFRSSELAAQTAEHGGAACVPCHASEVCRGGVAAQCVAGATNVNFRCVCAPGSSCPFGAASCTAHGSANACSDCPQNHWCYNNTRTPCAAHEVAPVNSSSGSACRCADGFYRHPLGACTVCPLHHVCRNETLRPVSQFDENLRTLSTGTADLRDAVCAAGMFRTALTDLCKPCPRNFFCPQTGVPLPNVIRCPENQFTEAPGATSPGDCVCLAGFRLLGNDEEARCLPCAVGERCQGGQVVEELCHLQNKVASADHESCVCEAGFGLVNFECAACPPGHVKPLAGDAPCLPCAMDTYAVNATTCLPCPEHSEARPASAACQCAAPYVWTANATCELCAADHFWQGGACHACPELARSDPAPGMLLGPPACRCAAGHHAVPQNVSGELRCTECAAGTYESGGQCRACGQGAWAPASSTAASACVCNAQPNASSTCHTQRVDGTCAGACASAPAACTQCLPGHFKAAYSTPGNSEECSACAGGRYQPASGASACEQCPEHEWHELLRQTSSAVCLCVPGFARPPVSNETDRALCQACTPGHYKDWLGEEPCLPCAVGRYNPDVRSTICHYCSDATADSEAWLRAIAPDVAAGAAHNSTRMVLESNTTVRAAAVSVLECVCDTGQEPRAVGDVLLCRRCMQGSFQERKGHEHCTYCGGLSVDHGHSLMHHHGVPDAGVTDTTQCAACPAFSGQNETLVGPGQLRMHDVSDCVCFPGHERVLSELASECRNCSQYMTKPSISDSACDFCPAGHFFIDRHVPCQRCDLPEDGGERHAGLVLNALDSSLPWGVSEDDCICRPGYERAFNSLCTACPAGKFRQSNLTRLCATCPQDTFQNALAQLSCLHCPPNSSTLSRYGSSAIQDCVCGPGFQPLSPLDSDEGVCQPCLAGTFRTNRMQNESDAPCVPCPENHYCPVGASTPVACPRGEFSEARSRTLEDCKCPPGFGRESHASKLATNESLEFAVDVQHNESRSGGCVLCAKGLFSDAFSNDACRVCPENKTTSSPGASNQTACTCVSGHGVDSTLPSEPCTPCLSGSFAAGGSNEPCKPCGWGTKTTPFAVPESFDTCMCNANLGVRLHAT